MNSKVKMLLKGDDGYLDIQELQARTFRRETIRTLALSKLTIFLLVKIYLLLQMVKH